MKKYLLLFLFTILFLAPQPSKADTFGYTTAGASSDNWNGDEFYGSLFTSGSAGDITSISQYVKTTSDVTNYKSIVVLHSNLNIITNGISPATVTIWNGANPQWETATYTTSPSITASTEYILGNISNTSDFYRYYDTGSANQEHEDTTNSYTSPTNPTDATHGGNFPSTAKFSIYASYSAGEPPAEEDRRVLSPIMFD